MLKFLTKNPMKTLIVLLIMTVTWLIILGDYDYERDPNCVQTTTWVMMNNVLVPITVWTCPEIERHSGE